MSRSRTCVEPVLIRRGDAYRKPRGQRPLCFIPTQRSVCDKLLTTAKPRDAPQRSFERTGGAKLMCVSQTSWLAGTNGLSEMEIPIEAISRCSFLVRPPWNKIDPPKLLIRHVMQSDTAKAIQEAPELKCDWILNRRVASGCRTQEAGTGKMGEARTGARRFSAIRGRMEG